MADLLSCGSLTEEMGGATIPEKWTISPIEYENANAVPKNKISVWE